MATYADSGVNIELGDIASKIMYAAARKTWENRTGKLGEIISPRNDFSGVRAINIGGLPEGMMLSMGFDGVGTKVEIAERMDNHSTVAFDLFAMVCDDAVVFGGEPVVIGSILDVKNLGKTQEETEKYMNQLADGYVAAAKQARVGVINGEIAELGARISGYGDFNYNWGASVIWIAHKDRLFTGAQIQTGDSIIALREKGFRSNGLSLLRKVMKDNYGEEWHTKDLNGTSMGELALIPSQIYCAAVVDMFDFLKGAAHITGGGIPGKLGRVLTRANKGATLNDLFPPNTLMQHAIEIGNVSKEEAYKTWNMGNGMLVIVRKGDEEKAIQVAKSHNIEAKICGEITDTSGIQIA